MRCCATRGWTAVLAVPREQMPLQVLVKRDIVGTIAEVVPPITREMVWTPPTRAAVAIEDHRG